MMSTNNKHENEFLAIKVHQWLSDWHKVDFNPTQHRRKPEPYFYMFTMSANDLKALSGIYRRPTIDGYSRESDMNIQRRHNKERSLEIRRFVEMGYPLSEIKKTKIPQDIDNLLKPGWLPTSIVVNILRPEDKRKDLSVSKEDLIVVNDIDEKTARIMMPESYKQKNWRPKSIHPIEVIDGQHRLWAFEDGLTKGNFELPVVAFYGLDISWQAYLFWVINIKPKKINPSLAFDLYPLLRTEDWLEKFEGPKIYRQTRAQELTEALWSYPKSSWYERIDMLGEHRQTMVSQAAWINSLLSTYIKFWEGRGIRIGGLFGAPIGENDMVLGWSRTQQAAFLIYIWNLLRDTIKHSNYHWADAIRKNRQRNIFGEDPAFSGNSSLLNTDQGVRGFLYVTNDLLYLQASRGVLSLEDWKFDEFDEADPETNAISPKLLDKALKSLLQEEKINQFVSTLISRIAEFDWRTASDESIKTDEEKMAKLVFRGSGGYRELRRQLLKHLCSEGDDISNAAEQAYKLAGLEI